jgi:site-specific DNA-methyltransferase (adenine-specific)
VTPYYADEAVTLYLGDCREVTEWLAADVLVTDPPYGRGWKQGVIRSPGHDSERHEGIASDMDTSARDEVLRRWGDRPAIAFGDLMVAPPIGTRQVLPYRKAPDAGTRGATAGFRRDAEAAYLIGPWPSGLGGRTSFLVTANRCHGHMVKRYGHPHAKPVDVMETLIAACPPGVIADPFAGSGSTLVAARNLGRQAVGIEIDERYAEKAARRLSQGVIDLNPPLQEAAP